MKDSSPYPPNAVAIVAMSGKFPGADNIETLWRNIHDGVESISRFSTDELHQSGVDPKLVAMPGYVPAAGVLPGIELFDAEFFHFTAREAECTDPQQRLLLECAWETLEQAGYLGQIPQGRTGVYVGTAPSSYWLKNLASNPDLISSASEVQLLVGNSNDYAATRISYKLNLTGPSLTIGTACSTSLVAVHLACTSLLDFHCDIALAGGAAIQAPSSKGYVYQEGGIMSPDGHCRPFDAAAAGTVSGSGVAMVALRRLEDAIEAGDTIHAIILGSAVNNDGLNKVGFLAPSEIGQAAVIAEALGAANVSADSIGYIEAHGTGTPLGDPIEIAALTRVFRRQTERKQFCALGSIKANLGHLDAVAGVAGLIKAVLALRHHTLPPLLHFENPNPKLNLENTPFFITNVPRPWTADSPRRAGVSSFGIGGTNAHVILQEAPPQTSGSTLRPNYLLVLSAKTRHALHTLCQNLAKHLERNKNLDLADVAFTLAIGRRSFAERFAIACENRDQAIAKLRSQPANAVNTSTSGLRVTFSFATKPSPGIQNGIVQLYQSEPAFRKAIDACSGILENRLGFRPANLLSAGGAHEAEFGAASADDVRALAQSFSLKYAFAALLRSWGIEPCAMIGYGLDQYLAAVLSGVFSLMDGLMLMCARARFTGAIADGAEAFLRNVKFNAPRVAFASDLTGQRITNEQAIDPGYWIDHFYASSSGVNPPKHSQDLPDALEIEIGAGKVSIIPSKRDSGIIELHTSQPSSDSLRSTEQSHTSLFAILGELWTRGISVDWNRFYQSERRRRISLPTYPFERQRYWIDPRTVVNERQPSRQPDQVKPPQSPIDSWFYAPRWIKSTQPESPLLSETAWVLIADDSGIADAVASLLHQSGAKAVMVRNGDSYSRLDSHVFVFPLEDEASHRKMWKTLDQPAWAESNILLFELGEPQTPNFWETGPRSALTRLLALVQGLNLTGSRHTLAVITNNTQAVHGGEVRRPEIATLSGALRVVQKEYPNLRCQACDLDYRDFEVFSKTQVAAHLISALACPSPSLALRAGTVWEHRVEPVRLDEAERPRIRQGGTYLITGGFGSMGLAFGEYLARTAQARLALVSRTELGSPPVESNGCENTSCAGEKIRFPLLNNISAIEELERAASSAPHVLPLSSYPGLEPLLNRCCAALAWQFVSGGFATLELGSSGSLEEVQLRLNVLPKFRKFLALLVHWLVEDGILGQSGDKFEIKQDPNFEPVADELGARFPQFTPLTDLISHCVRSYAPAFRGDIPAITVLYPDGTPRWLDEVMAKIPAYSADSVHLCAAADLVSHLIETQTEPIRILEVGGGTGDLTRHLIDLIREEKVVYDFTDISTAFVSSIREKAADRGLHNIKVSRFDISRTPEAQGLQLGSYDLVLGYNVVHATPDLVRTTSNLHSLLVEGGGLVLVESVNAPRWIDMIWGLTDGWWSFTDRHRRESSPLVSLEAWENVLTESGFRFATSFPRDSDARKHETAGLITGVASGPATPTNAVTAGRYSPEKIAQVRQRISQMEANGAKVCLIKADISDPADVARAVETAETTLGPIQGVIHTAGILGQTLIHDETPGAIHRVLAPKVDGTISLASVLADRPLDFFLLCSSLSSVDPIPGQFAYSAANSFLDSFAHFRAAKSTGLTVSVDWGFWQELGMIETARIPQSAKEAQLRHIQSSNWSQRGIDILARILQSNAPPQLLVTPRPQLDLPGAGSLHPSLNHPILSTWSRRNAELAVFSGSIVAGSTWVVDEHRISGHAVLPGTAYLDLAVTAFWHLHGRCPVELQDIFFLTPMKFAEGECKRLQVILQGGDGASEFRVLAKLADHSWQEHARGGIHKAPPKISRERFDLETVETDLAKNAQTAEDFSEFRQRTEGFTPHWRNVSSFVYGGTRGLGRFSLPSHLTQDLSRFALHPALLDTASGFLAFRREFDPFVPFSFGRVVVFDRIPSNCASVFESVVDADQLILAGSVVDLTGTEVVRIGEYTLRRATPDPATAKFARRNRDTSAENVRLEIASPGDLQTLLYRPAPRLHPRSDEVEIEVRSAGMNFVEVLYALGMLPSLEEESLAALGQECAGVVTRVGDSVSLFEPGQEVFGYGPACFSLYTRLSESTVALKPDSLSFEEAAGLPAAYLTAWHSLIRLARLQRNERILIHAAAGGVGLAAVRIAQWCGAEIFATAGSPSKRDFLQRIGVPYVMDSRSLLFADQVREITKGNGIDVVLNCLAGDFIPKSLGLLRRHGRFVELGKRDILRNTPLGLSSFANYIAFFAVDVGPDLPGFCDLWREVTTHLQSGTLPPLPHRVFDASRSQEAFEYMAQARHIGKVILSFTDAPAVRSAVETQSGGGDLNRTKNWEEQVLPAADPEYAPTASLGPQLATHERPSLASTFRAPESAAEKVIASVWEELLGVAPIGTDDDFFELNGDSLLAAQVMSRLQQLFETKVPISLIFGHPTIRELAAQIGDHSPTPTASVQSAYPTVYEEGAI